MPVDASKGRQIWWNAGYRWSCNLIDGGNQTQVSARAGAPNLIQQHYFLLKVIVFFLSIVVSVASKVVVIIQWIHFFCLPNLQVLVKPLGDRGYLFLLAPCQMISPYGRQSGFNSYNLKIYFDFFFFISFLSFFFQNIRMSSLESYMLCFCFKNLDA